MNKFTSFIIFIIVSYFVLLFLYYFLSYDHEIIISKNEKCLDDDTLVKFDITNITFTPVVGIYIDHLPIFYFSTKQKYRYMVDSMSPLSFKDYIQMLSMVSLNMSCSTDCFENL